MKYKFLVSKNRDVYLRIGKIKHLVVAWGRFNKEIRFSSNKMITIYNLNCFEVCSEKEFDEIYKKTLKSLIL